MKIIKYIFFFVCLYIYIYNPILQIFGFGIIKLLLLLAFVYLFITKKILVVFMNFKKELLILILIVLFLIPTTLLRGDATAETVIYAHIVWFLEGIFIPVFFLYIFNDIFMRSNLNLLIIFASTFAALITLFLILNPNLNIIVRDEIIVDTLDMSVSEWDFRGFSFAESSSFIYGATQGLIICICFYMVSKSVFYILPVILLFISILFNARIGFAVVIMGVILMLAFRKINLFSFFIVIMLIFMVPYLNFSNFINNNDRSLEWGFSFFTDTFNLIFGLDSSGVSNYSILSDTMVFLPEKEINILFGEGRSVFDALGKDSDIGYINQIFIGGIFYLGLLFFYLGFMVKRFISYSENYFFALLFMLTIIICNIKGSAFFISTGFFRIFTLYYVYSIYNKIIFNSELKKF